MTRTRLLRPLILPLACLAAGLAAMLAAVSPTAGATVKSTASTTAAPAAIPSTTADPVAYTDVPAGHPYAAAIAAISAAGAMTGYADGRFGPADPLTRQQFAKIIVLALRVPVSEDDVCPFGDVAPADGPDPFYPDHYVAVAAGHGVTTGISPTRFGPWQPIARSQLISMVVRALRGEWPGRLVQPPIGYVGSWPAGFSPEHGANTRLAQFNGLLAGLPLGSLDPWGPMTRGEAAQVLAALPGFGEGGPGRRPGPVVALQPSHQDDTGDPSWHEWRICGDIAQRTMSLLVGSPVTTVLAWETGMGLTGSNNDGSNARAFDSEIRRANEAGAAYFISIHNDGTAPSGVLGMYSTGDTRSAGLGETLARSVGRGTGLPYRGIRGRPLYSLDSGRNHASLRVLLEVGDNVEDRAFLEDPAGRQRIAAALAAEVSLLPVID